MTEVEYRATRRVPKWWAQARKLLIIPARFAFGWRFRTHCWRWMGVKVGDCYIGRDCLFDEEFPELITIETGARISWRVVLVAHDTWSNVVGPIRVCRNSVIALGAIVLPGVTIGEGSMVGAGAVVTRSVPPHTVVAGVPAKVIRSLEERPVSEPVEAAACGERG